jgi:hypothetical protein
MAEDQSMILSFAEKIEWRKEKARDRSPVLFETGCGQEQPQVEVVRVPDSRSSGWRQLGRNG